MEKGHLSIKQLESLKKADLQDLAKKLGVSDAGTVKELVARLSEVEIEIPEENELTEEEKAAAELAAAEDKETEAAAEDEPEEAGQKPDEPEEAGQQPEKPPKQEEPEAGKARVKAVTRYLDKQLNQIKEDGEVFTVDEERAAELVAAKVAEIVK